MAVVTINGKRTLLPSSTATAGEIVLRSGELRAPGRRAVYRTTPEGELEHLRPDVRYQLGHNDSFLTGPDRVKGDGETYFCGKEQWRRDLIADQVADVAQNVFRDGTVEIDEDCDWVVFDNFRLPKAWAEVNPGHETTRMMLIFPDEYPDLPTNGFYLPNRLRAPWRDHHFLDRGVAGAYGSDFDELQELQMSGWKWFCTHIKRGSWHPARLRRLSDWRRGDNLYHIIALAREVLTDPAAS